MAPEQQPPDAPSAMNPGDIPDSDNPQRIELSRRSGMLVVLSAPSGGGKSTISRALLSADSTLRYSISTTTRPQRTDEVDGQHYFFTDESQFEEMIAAGGFYEYARVHGNLYGTRKQWIEEQLEKKRDVVLDIDVQGGEKIKRQLPSAVLLFILPPSMAVLEQRLRARGTDKEEVIRHRLDNAKREIVYAGTYDYVVVNDRLEETILRIQRIIAAERHRTARNSIMFDGRRIEI